MVLLSAMSGGGLHADFPDGYPSPLNILGLRSVREHAAGRVLDTTRQGMPETIKAFDWAQTPLGAKASWSPALRTTYDILMGTGFASCATWGPEQTLMYNAAYIPFLGKRHPDALGRPIQDVWPDVWDDIRPLVDKALSGERVYLEDLHLVMTRNGYPEDTYWTFSYSPLWDGDAIVGMLDIAVDTTPVVAARRANALLIAEATHRMKNNLAVVQGIARQSLRQVSDRAAISTFEQRLQALSHAHDILHQHDWDTADLETLIDGALRKLVERTRYQLQGDPLQVSASVAQMMSLVMHELGTNATKYGAWSNAAGRVEVSWRIDGPTVALDWVESGGPTVVAPEKKSFGSKLIASGLSGRGDVETRFEPDGLRVSFKASLSSLSGA